MRFLLQMKWRAVSVCLLALVRTISPAETDEPIPTKMTFEEHTRAGTRYSVQVADKQPFSLGVWVFGSAVSSPAGSRAELWLLNDFPVL